MIDHSGSRSRQSRIYSVSRALRTLVLFIVGGAWLSLPVPVHAFSGERKQPNGSECAQPSTDSLQAQSGLWRRLDGPFADGILSLLTLKDGRILAGTIQQIFVSTDRGGTWNLCSTPGARVTCLKADTKGNILALAGSGLNQAMVSSDKGDSWRTLRVNGDSLWPEIIFSENGSLLVGGRTRVLYYSGDVGKTWSKARIPAGVGKFQTVGFTRDRQAITITDRKEILCSKDDGLSWRAIGTEYPYGFLTVRILENGDFLVVMGNGWLYKSSDQGKTWTENRDVDFHLPFVDLGEGHFLAASKTRGLMESSDHGNTWRSLWPAGDRYC